MWRSALFFRIPSLGSALATAVTLLATSAAPATAQQKISLIRDTEIEATIRAYSTPIFEAAGLDPRAVRIYLVNDNQINAFVAGGQNLFLNTGLLVRSRTAGQVVGVIAHEAGHIEGGHLARVHDALRRGTAESILAMVLGAAAAVAGRPDVGTAVALGGQDVALRNFLQYTRTQEGAADAAALRYLETTRQSARPLLEFFEILSEQDLLSPGRQDPYLRTHPLTRDRIVALEAAVGKSRFADAPERPEYIPLHARMKAKLHAFLDDPAVTLRRYPAEDRAVDARYARAIAYHRANRFDDARAEIADLIASHPGDPYFLELEGQFLFETGNAVDAAAAYRQAARLSPESPLIRLDLGRALVATGDPEVLTEAIEHLRAAVALEPTRPFAWRQLAIALGRDGELGESALALAEEALLMKKKPEAKFQAGKAERLLAEASPGWIRAQDIQRAIENEKDDD
jgi:predicted Zn-dependent protease